MEKIDPSSQERSPIKEIMCLSNLIKRSLDGARMERDDTVTPMHGFIIGYLSRHADEDVFQKDIEKTFSYRRSTASTVLGLMEEKGLISSYEMAENGPRPRKYYRITNQGRTALSEKVREWRLFSRAVDAVMGGGTNENA